MFLVKIKAADQAKTILQEMVSQFFGLYEDTMPLLTAEAIQVRCAEGRPIEPIFISNVNTSRVGNKI
ncbi:hypothetical protein ACFX2J_031377 [Malus domestica]